MQFQVIMVTDPQTHTQTGLIIIHCAAKLSVQCNDYTVKSAYDTSYSKSVTTVITKHELDFLVYVTYTHLFGKQQTLFQNTPV